MRQIAQAFKIKKLIFILIASIFILSFASAITLDSTAVLNTTVSNSSITFSIEVTASEITIEPTYIYLTDVSYIQGGVTKTCATLNHSTANTVLDSANFPCTGPDSPDDPDSPGGGGGIPTFNPTEEQLKEGYTNYFYKGWKANLIINNISYLLEIKDVTANQVNFFITGEDYVIVLNTTSKLNLDENNYYDLQIVLESIIANKAKLSFQEIHEEIPAEKQEEQEEKSKIEDESKWWIWLIFGALGILILLQIIFYFKKLRKRKRFMYSF